ncbi:M4 family metallopeptidase [Streptosporangium saharense]|uniref:M4 family metallopeptidase n=1 Tax=Streptosporangium saharense TaxID=1706840 RepID=UPI0036CD9BBA
MKPNGRSPIAALLAAALAANVLYGAPSTAAATEAPAPGTHAPPDARSRSRALDSADRALAGQARELLAGDGDTFERPTVVFGPRGLQYLTYRRLHHGLPVYGGDVIVATDREGGTVTTVTTGQRATLDGVATKPVVTAERAREIARNLLGTVTEQSAPRLTVHAAGTRPRLTWESVVKGSSKDGPSVLHVYVDAADGSITDRWDDVRRGIGHSFYNGDPVYLDTRATGDSYTLTDPLRPGVSCAGPDNRILTGPDDDWGDGTATNPETTCVDVLFAVQHEWDMMREWLGRNGIDGAGRAFPVRVGVNIPDATWSGSSVDIGHNVANTKPLSSLDVVGHEFGHAVFQTTSGGSGSGLEAYALNESTGDIFGALTEHYVNHPPELDEADYLVGEEVDYDGDRPLRNMYDPASLGDPGCYTPDLPNQEPHKAAGVQNHWFYLLAEGDRVAGRPEQSPVCAGTGVTGVGLRDAGEIFMGALNLKTVPWTHAKARTATVRAAFSIFPGCLHAQRVKDAWDAVGVAASPGEPTCPSEPRTFMVRPTESGGVVDQGASTAVTLRTRTLGAQSQDLTLSAEGLPEGANATFSPARVPSGADSTMTVTTSATTPVGTHTVVVRATSATSPTLSHAANYRLTVTPASPANDFSVALGRDTATVDRGTTATLTLSTATTRGDPQKVALSAVGLPDSVSFTFNPSTVTTGQNARVTVHPSAQTPPGPYLVTVRATGAARRTTTLRLNVRDPREPDFSVRLTPEAASVEVGGTTLSVLETTTDWGDRQRVDISASGVPAGVNVAANPRSIETGSSSTITFGTSATTAPGTYPITVSAVSAVGSVTRSATFTLTVKPRPVPAWRPYTPYAVGDRVTHGGTVYRCVIKHVSLPGWEPPRAPALWARVQPTK